MKRVRRRPRSERLPYVELYNLWTAANLTAFLRKCGFDGTIHADYTGKIRIILILRTKNWMGHKIAPLRRFLNEVKPIGVDLDVMTRRVALSAPQA